MNDDGTVTAEVAVAMTSVVLLLAGLLSAATVAVAQVRVTDAAGAGARAAARGESPAVVREVAVAAAGPGASAVVDDSGELVTVTASAPVEVPLLGAPVVTVRSTASARVEGGP